MTRIFKAGVTLKIRLHEHHHLLISPWLICIIYPPLKFGYISQSYISLFFLPTGWFQAFWMVKGDVPHLYALLWVQPLKDELNNVAYGRKHTSCAFLLWYLLAGVMPFFAWAGSISWEIYKQCPQRRAAARKSRSWRAVKNGRNVGEVKSPCSFLAYWWQGHFWHLPLTQGPSVA